jgi:type I restriction enzyme R subunit
VATKDEMGKVNPEPRAKTHFVIVDCVGVCEQAKSDSKPLDRPLPALTADLLGSVNEVAVAARAAKNSAATGVVDPAAGADNGKRMRKTRKSD